MSPSAQNLWQAFRLIRPDAPELPYECFHFCDNREDADLCADLVVQGIKRATAASVAELEMADTRHPVIGDFSVVTRWDGQAVAVIETTRITLRRLDDVDADFAEREGEGDKSLSWWRTAHEAYYRRVMAPAGIKVDGDLMIICEEFERVF